MKKATGIAIILMLAAAMPAFAQTRTANFASGDRVAVVLKVNVRSTPNGEILGTQAAGAQGALTGSPVVTGGYTWWKVEYDSGPDGWSAEDFMLNASAPIAKTNLFSNAGLAAGVAFATQPSLPHIMIGTAVVTTSNLNVRDGANGALISTVSLGSTGKVVGGSQNAGGHIWWQIKYDAGVTGWSVADYLSLK